MVDKTNSILKVGDVVRLANSKECSANYGIVTRLAYNLSTYDLPGWSGDTQVIDVLWVGSPSSARVDIDALKSGAVEIVRWPALKGEQ